MHYVIVSGGFDPLHIGHVDMFNEAAKMGSLVVCLNSDEWLSRKKGKPFMAFEERASIIRNLRSVTRVVAFDDSDGTACDGIQHVVDTIRCYEHPNSIVFANGGDRTSDNTPEQKLCEKLGVEMVWGIGGGKVQSSSDLLRSFGKLGLKYEQRPWGEFEVLLKEKNYQVKRLTIKPEHGISLQYHKHRSENWTVVQGEAYVINGDEEDFLSVGDSVDILVGNKHRLRNNGLDDLIVIETQFGDYLEEDDIVRLEDPYNR